MKNTHICPKCNSSHIYIVKGKTLNQYSRFQISAFQTVAYDRYICIECGFMEEWITNPKHLNMLDRKKSRQKDDFTDFV